MSLVKLFQRIIWHNNTTPAINEDNLNAMSKAIDDIDDRVILIGNDVITVIPQIQQYLEQAQSLAEGLEQLSENPPYIGANGNWYIWDTNTSAYIDSEIDASITVDIADVNLLPVGQAPYITNTGTDTNPVFHLYIPQAKSITNVVKNGQYSDPLRDMYDIIFNDGTRTSFIVTNGVGIVSITKTGTQGLVDTYDIACTDGMSYEFTVTNGENGTDGAGVPTGGTTGQVLTKKSNSNYDTEWKDVSGGVTPQDVDNAIGAVNGIVNASAFEPITSTVINKYIQNRTGQLFDNNDATLMEFSVQEGEQYRITGSYRWKIAIMGIYNGNACIDTYPNDDVSRDNLTTETITITIPTGITTLRACSYQRPLTVEKLEPNGKSVDFSANILYGKKWAVCGDSFTCGDFTGYVDKQGHSGTNSDAYDTATQSWKTYSWWISQRNKMDIQELAMGGNSFTNLSGATRPFSNPNTSTYNYTQIANDCDYITLAFGLNESGLTSEQIGTKTDTTNETLWGAYNVVLEAILTANPSVKIGIIVTDAWLSQTYHDALIEIAKYWGIPYLDLRNGEEVPMMIGGELREHSATARTLRNSAFSIDGSNSGHPTPLGFKYRSTVIENFLRSL